MFGDGACVECGFLDIGADCAAGFPAWASFGLERGDVAEDGMYAQIKRSVQGVDLGFAEVPECPGKDQFKLAFGIAARYEDVGEFFP